MTFNTNPRTYVEPVQTPDATFGRDDITENHPAYAMIGASRVSGNKVLYGSEFVHQHYITIKIGPGQVRRSLSNDWFGSAGGREYIEVALSESQWAAFISRMNQGEGVPCTQTWRSEVGYIPQIPEPPKKDKQFADEMRKLAQNGDAALKELGAAINELKISEKAKKELLWKVEQASRSVGGSAKFVAEQFGEHMEKTKDSAKTEIFAFMESHIRRSGLEALGVSPNDVLSLGNDDRTIDAE